MMQGVAMLLQNRYQRQRLYTRIALGKVLIQIVSAAKNIPFSVLPCFISILDHHAHFDP
jgi:hypothetical protein